MKKEKRKNTVVNLFIAQVMTVQMDMQMDIYCWE